MDKELRRKRVAELYLQEGKSINQISKELKVSWETVKKDLLFLGIEINKSCNQYSKSNGVSDKLFEKIEDSDSAYWLGFLYADGSIRQNRNEISLDLKKSDYNSIKDFHDFCGNKNSIREHKIIRGEKVFLSYVSSFSNAKVKENLEKLGCVPKKSLVLKFPNEQQVPTQFIYDFVRGYIDGDGYVEFNQEKRKYRIAICGTEDFLKGLILRLNLFDGCQISKDSNSKIFLLTIQRKQVVFDLLKQLYENSKYHLDRKYEIFLKAQRAYEK